MALTFIFFGVPATVAVKNIIVKVYTIIIWAVMLRCIEVRATSYLKDACTPNVVLHQILRQEDLRGVLLFGT